MGLMGQEPNQIQRTNAGRINRLLIDAASVELRVEWKGSLFYFFKKNGESSTQYGIWASELFVAGYKFCYHRNYKTGSWMDDDDDE